MNTVAKSALAAVAFTLLASGAAWAAEDCCCKEKDAKMACCDKKAPEAAGPKAPAAANPQHQH